MTLFTVHPHAQLLTTSRDITDNDSLGSTFAVDALPGQQKLHLHSQDQLVDENSGTTRSSSRVSFDLSRNVLHDNTKDYEEIAEQWYDRDDYVEMRVATKVLAKQAIDHDRTLASAVSYKTVVLKAFHACQHATKDTDPCLLEKKDEGMLKKFLSNPFRVGMGCICVMSLQADKVTRRRTLVAAVREAQENIPSELSSQERIDFIKRVAEDISRPSRLLARRVACKQWS